MTIEPGPRRVPLNIDIRGLALPTPSRQLARLDVCGGSPTLMQRRTTRAPRRTAAFQLGAVAVLDDAGSRAVVATLLTDVSTLLTDRATDIQRGFPAATRTGLPPMAAISA